MLSRRVALAFLVVFLSSRSVPSETIRVPWDQPTIQGGIDAASAGDTVLVDCGTYPEHDIELKAGIAVRSHSGDPSCVVVDARELGRCFFAVGLTERTTLAGLTLLNGDSPSSGGALDLRDSDIAVDSCDFVANRSQGGGALASWDSILLVQHSRFVDNVSCLSHGGFGSGGAVYAYGSSSSFEGCEFVANSTCDDGGGAIRVIEGDCSISACVFVENITSFYGNGDAIHVQGSAVIDRSTFWGNGGHSAGSPVLVNGEAHIAHAVVDRCIFAFNNGGSVAAYFGGTVSISCTDIFGNVIDWGGTIADQATINGNFSEDPLFCDPDNGILTIQSDSPCAPPGITGCGLVGALPVGCGPTPIEALSWGRIKSDFSSQE